MISSKLSDDKDIQEIIKNMETDEEVIEFLKSKGYDYGKVIKTLEKYYGFNYIDLKNVEVDYDLLSKFDLNKLEKNLVFPYKYEEVGNKCFFAINDITNQNIIKNIKEACKSVNLIPVFNFSFDFEITHIYTVVHSKVNIIENSTDFNAQNWVSSIIDEGILRGASDIHIENLENCLQVRYRIDGVLTNIKEFNFSETTISSICVRIKIISAMDIAEKRKPQDGRIDNYEFIGSKYDIRVSSIRTIFGEKFVMRLIEKSSDTKTFEQLGFNNENEEKIKRMLANQNGIVYLAGATGSGKTTTLYTMIEHINNSDINIYTIENPVEKTINKVNQIQINPMA
jgi:type IV pilus assembly protein PilB